MKRKRHEEYSKRCFGHQINEIKPGTRQQQEIQCDQQMCRDKTILNRTDLQGSLRSENGFVGCFIRSGITFLLALLSFDT
jgi:hypothetical protein